MELIVVLWLRAQPGEIDLSGGIDLPSLTSLVTPSAQWPPPIPGFGYDWGKANSERDLNASAGSERICRI